MPDLYWCGFMAGLGATAAAASTLACAANAAPNPYHTAGELLQMLTSGQVSACELVDVAIARRRPM